MNVLPPSPRPILAVLLPLFAVVAGCGMLPTSDAQLQSIKLSARELELALRYAASTSMGLGSDLKGQPRLAEGGGGTPAAKAAVTTRRVDLRAQCPPVYHQGPFMSCTAFTVAKGLGEFLLRRRGDHTPLSAAHMYVASQGASRVAQARLVGGANGLVGGANDLLGGSNDWVGRTKDLVGGVLDLVTADPEAVAHDTGTALATAIATLEMGGAIAETQGPYPAPTAWGPYARERLTRRQARSETPGPTELAVLARHFALGRWSLEGATTVRYDGLTTVLRIKRAARVADLAAVKASPARGRPVAFGLAVDEGLYGADVAKTGRIPLPVAKERYLGGHAMLAVGYDDDDKTLLVRNSWGEAWGDKGYGHLPYAAFGRGLVRDGWTVAEE